MVGAVGGALVGLIFPPFTLAVLAQVGRTGHDTLCIHSSAVLCVAISKPVIPIGAALVTTRHSQ